jgi:hypothetical protein
MKKDLPYSIPIKIPFEIGAGLAAHIYRIERNLEESYRPTLYDLEFYLACVYVFCDLDQTDKKDHENFTRPRVQAMITRIKLDKGIEINEVERKHYQEFLNTRHKDRIAIVKKEVARTMDNEKRIETLYLSDYRRLIEVIRNFDQETLIDWFIPIHLDFKGFVHIYVRHVDETKFGVIQNGKPRSFLKYKYELILRLLKKILEKEKEEIKEHFIEVIIGIETKGDYGKVHKYFRGIMGRPPIEYNGDKFALEIESTGRIAAFYQLYPTE